MKSSECGFINCKCDTYSVCTGKIPAYKRFGFARESQIPGRISRIEQKNLFLCPATYVYKKYKSIDFHQPILDIT
ncbi:hypothetical protein GCM10028804_53150 [Larkinella terrae]